MPEVEMQDIFKEFVESLPKTNRFEIRKDGKTILALSSRVRDNVRGITNLSEQDKQDEELKDFLRSVLSFLEAPIVPHRADFF